MKSTGKLAMFAGAALLATGAIAAPSVEVVNIQQQYPWTNTVDITYTVQGIKDFPAKTATGEYASNETYFVTFEATEADGKTPIADMSGNTIFTNALINGSVVEVAQWSPALNLQLTECKLTPSVFRGEDDAYLVINLETNAEGKLDWWHEPMSTQEESNRRYNTPEYKTTKMVFRRIPADTYTIGYNLPSGYTFTYPNSEHEVSIPADYYLAIFQLTEAQYDRIVGAAKPSASTLPKTSVSWNTMRGSASSSVEPGPGPIATFAEATGLCLDFPTHAMYEVALRARSRKLYVSGDDATNIRDYAVLGAKSRLAVGSRKPNPWGIFDGTGNGWVPTLDLMSTTDLATVERALANGFIPSAPAGANMQSIRCVAGNYQDAAGPNGKSIHAASMSSSSAYKKTEMWYYNRLAIYPKGFYPNGGQK